MYRRSSPIALGVVVGLAVLLVAAMTEASVMNECKTLSVGPGYDFCVKLLQGQPDANNANTTGLAIICADVCIKNAQSAMGIYQQLVKNETQAPVKSSLQECVELYKDAQDNSLRTKVGIQVGDFGVAHYGLSAALTDTENCKESLQKSGGDNNVTGNINDSYEKILYLTFAFVEKIE